jgi:hypothetical protein
MAEPVPGTDAAGWLARQLVDGERVETVFDGIGYPDYGLTADIVLALDSAGVAQDFAGKAATWLSKADNVTGYAGDGTDESYAGPHAKLALVAQAQGLDPTKFGGVDLLAGLRARQTASGRFSDKSLYGDFSNGITQSLGVIVLDRAGDAPGPAATYLADSACDDGGFPLFLDKETCVSDVDTTGFAVQAMLAAGHDGAATAGLNWLAGKQQSDGSFGGSGPTSSPNANSTGLAAQALRASGRGAAADKAVAYLMSLQVGCAGPADHRGGIAYDATGFDPGNAPRATAQAIPGIVGVSLADVTADGASAVAPTVDCSVPTSSPEPTTATTSPTETSTSSATSVPSDTTTTTTVVTASPTTTVAPVPAASPAPAELAETGAEIGPVFWLGAVMLLAGAGAVLVVRPRFAKGDKR